MPSHHSSSSHSSSFRSSSFSRSSSSFSSRSRSSPSTRSSSSFSRSSFSGSRPSSRSSSSHSSYGYKPQRSTFSSFTSGYRTRPSQKPLSTHGSHFSGKSALRPQVRPRFNQPLSPSPVGTIIHCLSHDYIYYPVMWNYNGQQYEAGYYDEEGKRYENVAFREENGETTVELECEYCGSKAKYKWEEGMIPNCANCGAPMTVKNLHTDTVISGACGDISFEQETYSTRNNGQPKKKRRKTLLWIVAVFFVLGVIGSVEEKNSSNNTYSNFGQNSSYNYVNLVPQNSTLYLKKTGNGIYDISDSSDYSKKLKWEEYDEAYYDETTGAWLWYNTDVKPAVWQYWYDGISSKYGDFGWMECEGDTWYIEISYGNWQKYTGNTASLWHIRNEFDF